MKEGINKKNSKKNKNSEIRNKKGILVELPIISSKGEKTGTFSVPKEIFNAKISLPLLAHYTRVYLSHQKGCYSKTKTRGEVAGSTRKIYRQKGTGRARHGDIKAPIFVGGGVVHGPTGIKRVLKINKKQRRKALYTALSIHAKNNSASIIDSNEIFTGKTKDSISFFKSFINDKVKNLLVIYGKNDPKTIPLSLRNIDNIFYTDSRVLNAYNVIRADHIFFTREGINDFLKHYELKSKKS